MLRLSWVIISGLMRFEGESAVTEHVPNERLVIESQGGIVSTWTWLLESHDGGTKLDLDIEYTVPAVFC